MGKNDSFDYQYNAQISVDGDNQIIIGQHLSQNANDKQEIETALAAIKDDIPSADNGYTSGDILQALEDSPIDTLRKYVMGVLIKVVAANPIKAKLAPSTQMT